MKIVSVNVGLPREVVWKGGTVRTAVFKEPVAGTVAIRELRRDPELLQRATNVGSLPENWRTQLLLRAQDQV